MVRLMLREFLPLKILNFRKLLFAELQCVNYKKFEVKENFVKSHQEIIFHIYIAQGGQMPNWSHDGCFVGCCGQTSKVCLPMVSVVDVHTPPRFVWLTQHDTHTHTHTYHVRTDQR